ncbi:EAL and HDOD domain-containing protein [Phosphitispora sp. TUW77]|uniref:EAL and HDOD domain-containing protein n=1 Tax=Phosphitispora sp. TUW77 TaxID=3152361 RepID=UPI003AB4218B
MDVFVARQPIFNRCQQVFGYELLYRLGTENYYPDSNGDYASSEVIANSFLLFGLESLTGGKRAFINFTENLLKNEVAANLPNDLIAVEILEHVKRNKEIVTACKRLKELGYMLVLDDFVYESVYEPLLDIADIIKIDFLETPSENRKNLINKYRNKKVNFLAEKVETIDDFKQALESGFTYFQGYFFSKPIIISGKDIPANKLNYIQLLHEINMVDLDFDRLDNIIKRDVSLSYKLLRYINSAAFGFRTKITSIKHALVMLGIQEIKKWLSLITLKGMCEDKPDEILTSSIIRARFGELIAQKCGLADRSSDLFLVGMFSLIDAIIGRSMSDILAELPVSEDVKKTLLGEKHIYRDIFELILSYEKGDWKSFSYYASLIKLDEKEVPQFYIMSLEWANGFNQI